MLDKVGELGGDFLKTVRESVDDNPYASGGGGIGAALGAMLGGPAGAAAGGAAGGFLGSLLDESLKRGRK